MSNKDTKIFVTSDLGLAAYLQSSGFQIIGINKSNPQKVEFSFKLTLKLENSIDLYWIGKASVNARTYFDSLKLLKNRIYSFRE